MAAIPMTSLPEYEQGVTRTPLTEACFRASLDQLFTLSK